MKIFYVTNINNKHPYTTAFARLWKNAGHEITLFEMYGFESNPAYADTAVPKQVQMNRDFIAQCIECKPDMLFVFKGDTISRNRLGRLRSEYGQSCSLGGSIIHSFLLMRIIEIVFIRTRLNLCHYGIISSCLKRTRSQGCGV